ncbi:MAG: hypothetical protein ABSA52_02455 [Candidatus Binatia bacterium]
MARSIGSDVGAADRREPHFLLEKVKEVVTECRTRSAAHIVLGAADLV